MRLVRPYITEWGEEYAGHWDSAIKGNSALRAHLFRAMDLELAAFKSFFTVHMLWDLRNIFDSVRIEVLAPKLIELSYPPQLLTLGFIAHKAPRILMVGTSLSDILCCMARSMIAGCQQSCSWARGLLHGVVAKMCSVIPTSICYEHVDDLSQIIA